MKKREWVYRELAQHALQKEKGTLTQLMLSKKLGISISTVNGALKPLERIGAVRIGNRGVGVTDVQKLILYWASARNLDADVIYYTRSEERVGAIEKSMPAGALFSAFSAYKFLFADVPADYSEVYVYCKERDLEEVKRRFPKKEGPANVFVLKSDKALVVLSKKGIAPLSQAYVDLWNLPQWYAKDFANALEGRFSW